MARTPRSTLALMAMRRLRRTLGGSQALNLTDGNRVHFEPIDCLIRFGKRWRGDAQQGTSSRSGSNRLALTGISYDRG